MAAVVALHRRLDLDHARPHVGEHHRAVGPRENAGKIDNEKSGEGAFASHALSLSSPASRAKRGEVKGIQLPDR